MIVSKPFPKSVFQKQLQGLQHVSDASINDTLSRRLGGGGSNSKYDHLKKVAEKLMYQQASVSTEIDVFKNALTESKNLCQQLESDINDLSAEKAKLITELKNERSKQGKIQHEIVATQALCDVIANTLGRCEEKVREGEKDREELREVLRVQKARTAELEAKVVRMKEELNITLNSSQELKDRLNTKIVTLQERLEESQTTTADLEARLQEKEQEIQRYHKSLANGLTEFNSLKSALQTERAEHATYITHVKTEQSRLSSCVKKLEEELTANQASKDLLKTEKQAAIVERDTVCSTLEDLRKTHHQEKATLEAAIEAKTTVEFDLRRSLQEVTTLKELLEEEKKDYETRLAQIETDFAKTRQELESSRANAQLFQQDLADIERDLEAKTVELEDVLRLSKKKEKEHKASIKTLEDYNSKALDDLEASNSANTTNRFKEIEDQLLIQRAKEFDLKSSFTQLEAQYSAKLKEKDEELTKANKKVQGLVDSLSSELLSMKDQCDQDSKRLEQEYKEQVEELKCKLKELIQQQENSGVEIASLMENNAELKKKNQEEQKTIEDLQVKLSKRRAGVRGSQAAEKERENFEKEKERERERERTREKMEQEEKEKQEKAKAKEKEKQKQIEKEKVKEKVKGKEKRKVVARSTPSKPKEKPHEHAERFPDDEPALQEKEMSSEDTSSKKRFRKRDEDGDWIQPVSKTPRRLSSGLPKSQTKRIQETKTVEKTVSSKPSSLCSKGSKSDSSKRVGQVRTKTIHRSQMDLFEDVFSFNE